MKPGYGGLLYILILLIVSTGCKDKSGKDVDEPLFPPLGAAFSGPNGQVTFFDLRSDEVETVEQMNGWSLSACFSASGTFVALSENQSDGISLYTLPEFEVLRQIDFGASPVDIILNSSSTLLYVVTANANFRRLSLTGNEIDTIGVGLHPRRMSLRPHEESEMWVACRGDSSIHILDVFNFNEIQALKLPSRPTDVKFTRLGSTAYVAMQNGAGIWELDASSRELVQTYPAGSGPIDLALSPDGRFLAASDSSQGTVRIWNLSQHLFWDILVGGRAGRARITRDSRSLYVISMAQNRVTHIALTDSIPYVVGHIQVSPTVRELALWELQP